MPRSSRHKSSKHRSRDARDYSDPEKDSTVRERKSKDESGVTVSKESGSGEKRKFDTKEHSDSISGDYYEERNSSKRHKEKVDDSANGGEEERGESSKKSRTSSGKSRKREEVESEDTKKSSGKHRESSRKESKRSEKERDKSRDKKYKEGKSDKLFDGEEHHGSRIVSSKIDTKAQDQVQSPGPPDLKVQDQVQSPVSENYSEKRSSRRKREDHGIDHKLQGDVGVVSDRVLAFAIDSLKDGKHKEEKCRDRNRVISKEANKQRGDEQRDDRPDKEYTRSDGKDVSEGKRKKTKFQENDHGHEPDSGFDGYHEREYDRGRDRDLDRDRDRVRDRDRDRVRDRGDRDRDRVRDRGDYERDRYHERDWDRSRDRDRDYDREKTREREKDRSRDYYHDRERSKTEHERESDQTGQYKDSKERRRSPDDQDDLSDSKSRITPAHANIVTRGSRGEPDDDRTRSQRQPSSSVVQEDIRNNLYQKAKNRGSENTSKVEDGFVGEVKVESRSLEIEETGQRNITRDIPAFEADKTLVDDTSQAELSFNNKANQNSSSYLPRPESRGGISSPKVAPLEEDSRANTAGRYKRAGNANMGRGQQSNVWRASPNWQSPVIPNGFSPFQYALPHGGFQSMMPQFPPPSPFGVRPQMDMSHSGIPYHMTDQMRPLGWQNMHGFFGDLGNGHFKDESRMYGGVEWDHNRRMQGQGWDSGADAWKTQNGHVSMDVSSMSAKSDNSAQALEGDRAKSVEGANLVPPAKELASSSPKEAYVEDTVTEKVDSVERYARHYLSKLDISVQLTDPELLTQCMELLNSDTGRTTSDDGISVFVNLKDGGKALPKAHPSSLTSLIPAENNSVFQIAMDLYREQRYEIKSLPDVKYDQPNISSPGHENETKTNTEVGDRLLEIGDAPELETPQKVEQEAALPEEKEEGGSCSKADNTAEALEDAEMLVKEEEEKKDVMVIIENNNNNNDDVSSKVVAESGESVITRIHH